MTLEQLMDNEEYAMQLRINWFKRNGSHYFGPIEKIYDAQRELDLRVNFFRRNGYHFGG